jgi:4-amino-4-deoxy-L-arabinose transferase-like glycosyltransferase
MSRLGKMPIWQRLFVIGGMFACSVTGFTYLLGHEFQLQRQTLGSHNILVAHGIAAMLATLALGSVLPFHLKAGYKSKRNWVSGFSQLAFLIVLLVSGALLYYGPEDIRDGVIEVHWVVGLLFFAIFILHAFQKIRGSNKRM